MNLFVNKSIFFIILFSVLSVFAENVCDHFLNGKNSLKPEETQAFFKGNIDYSKAYIEVPFLNNLKPGIYIHVKHGNLPVVSVAYMSRNSNIMQIYKEPFLERGELDEFTPCIDRHIKANMSYFLKTCLFEKEISQKGVFKKIESFMRDRYEEIVHPCKCEDDILNATIIYIKEDRSVRLKEFNSPTCLDDSFDVDPIVLEWRAIDSLVKELVIPFDDRCAWQNLVLDPKKFSSEKYKNGNTRFILKEKDCPSL